MNPRDAARASAREFEGLLHRTPVLAIIRHADSTHTARVAEVLADSGIVLAEVTTTTPGWVDIVRAMDPRIHAGVGSVTTVQQVEDAAANGARFIVSPGLDAEVVDKTLHLGMEPVPGCITPSEVQAAHRLGARTIKLFPASAFGAAYVRALRAPFPALRALPTGGVTIDDIPEWMDAGAVGVALGSELVGRTSSAAPADLDVIGARAREALARARATRPGSS